MFGEIKDNVELLEHIKQFNLNEWDYKIFTGESRFIDSIRKCVDIKEEGYGAGRNG